MRVEVKEIEALPVLIRRRRLTLPEVGAAAAEECPRLEDEAAARGLAVSGRFVFSAAGLPMDAATPFDLAFCLPVAAGADCERLPPFRCAAIDYRGPLADLFAQGYRPLLEAIAAAGHVPSGSSREVYHRWAGPGDTHNHVEIQIGLR
ncbi:GyrI-like domain-containing protein [Salinarimonas rosea]|uniref:GyrI-like domain-containing protein n=1 Tax=Salinarimonas rosea TaxID=552063 RepID=UPI000429946F|nr:GyrI-like domain-containing protein [Salinarimonas rosea]